jgi:hypothetical protein
VLAAVGLAGIAGVVGLCEGIGPAADPGHEATFQLKDVSVFSAGHNDFLRGQVCRCQTEPLAQVQHYPAFVSKVPIFGMAKFGGRGDDTNSAVTCYFALDESGGAGKGYDRLYFDANRDLDLRNDPVLGVQRTSPDQGYKPNYAGIKSLACFDFLNLDFGGTGAGSGRVEVMPRLLITGNETNSYRYLFFVRTHLFEGDIKFGGEKFHAVLGDDYAVVPDLNAPGTALGLTGRNGSFDWWGGDRIQAMHKVGGHYYSFSASQDGQLTVRPYAGDLGIFKAGPGGRAVTNFTVTGSFDGRSGNVAVGGDLAGGRPGEAASCEIPAGDYLPDFLTVQFGRLRIQISQNYHTEGMRQSRNGRPNVYGLTVRKDLPCVLDFSNKPLVMFTSPTNTQRIKVGGEVTVMAVLTDPKLDFMIRHLDDTTRQQTKDADGKELGYQRNLSLDPRVIITRASGEKVAEGVMPYG